MGNKEIGARIRKQRKYKGFSQEELAKKAGLSTMSIRRYESGERAIPELAFVHIADALDVTTDYLDPSEELFQANLGRGFDRLFLESGTTDKYSLSSSFQRIAMAFDILNDAGREKAAERVEELTEIPRYQKEPETPPQALPREKGDTTSEE